MHLYGYERIWFTFVAVIVIITTLVVVVVFFFLQLNEKLCVWLCVAYTVCCNGSKIPSNKAISKHHSKPENCDSEIIVHNLSALMKCFAYYKWIMGLCLSVWELKWERVCVRSWREYITTSHVYACKQMRSFPKLALNVFVVVSKSVYDN